MQEEIRSRLIREAIRMRERAYVPYSSFSVGAALLTEDGEIITGCNVENSAYPAGLCAERVAIFSAVAAGHTRFSAIAVSGGYKGREPADYCMPCGMCRQVMAEFSGPELIVLIVKSENEVKEYTLGELLPHVFTSLDTPER